MQNSVVRQESWSYGLQRWQAQLFDSQKTFAAQAHVGERDLQAFATTLTEKINSAQACCSRTSIPPP